MTDTQRLSWTLYAQALPLTGRLGDPVRVPGAAHYIRSNITRLKLSLPLVDDAPTCFHLGEPPRILDVIAAAAFGALEVTYDDTQAWVTTHNARLIAYVTAPREQSINRPRMPYVLIPGYETGAVPPPVPPAIFATPLGNAFDKRVWCRFRILYPDGRVSPLTPTGPHLTT